MFEARFQTFDDLSERAASAGRVAALRAELKRRGIDGFVAATRRPLTRTNTCRRARSGWPGSPASPARPASLIVAGRPRRAVRRRPLHPAGRPTQTDPAIFSIVTIVETAADQWIEAEPLDWYTSSATIPGCTRLRARRALSKRLRKGRRNACRRRQQSDRRDLERSPVRRRLAPSCCMTCVMQAIATNDKLQNVIRRDRQDSAPMRCVVIRSARTIAWLFNIRGSRCDAYAAAAAFAHRAERGPAIACISTDASSIQYGARTNSNKWPTCAQPDRARQRISNALARTRRRAGSIRQPPPMPSTRSHERAAARSFAAPIRSR